MKIFRKARQLLNLPDYINKDLPNQLAISNIRRLSIESNSIGISSDKISEYNITISLTTHKKRILDVHLVLESLMHQTIKPNRIILWLCKDEFSENSIPYLLNRYKERGLMIFYVDNFRSHTKLVPALEMFPEDIIVTVDDDLIYRHDMLENLVKPFLLDPGYIYFNRGHRIVMNNGIIAPYLNWEWNIEDSRDSMLNFPTGVGGILYPPKSLDNEVLNKAQFLEICPLADDVWFKAMALLKGTPSRKVSTYDSRGLDYILLDELQTDGLQAQNNGQNKNDQQIKLVFEKYNLKERLMKEPTNK